MARRVRGALAGAMGGLAVGAAGAQQIDVVSYQGRLVEAGVPATGGFDLRFRLFDLPVGGVLLGEHTESVTIAAADNGVFRVDALPFGGLFDGTQAWIEIRVTENGTSTTLSPRQLVTLAPHAGFAQRSGTTLQEAYDNGAGIVGDVDVEGTVDLGASGSATGGLRVFGDFTGGHIIELRAEGTRGGRVDVRDNFNRVAGTMGIDSNGGGRIIVTRNTAGDTGFNLDGNVSGTEAPRIDLIGPSRTIVLDTSIAGNASVVIPDGSISAAEIGDEPGVASINVNNASVNLTSTVSSITSRSITVPGPGFIVAVANVEMLIGFTTGTEQAVDLGLSDVSNAFFQSIELSYDIPANASSSSYNFIVSPSMVFPVTEAGSKTIFVVGARVGGNAGNTVRASDVQLTLLYVPTSYGAVGTGALSAPSALPDGALPGRAGMTPVELVAEQLAEARRHSAALAERQRVLERLLDEQQRRLEEIAGPGR